MALGTDRKRRVRCPTGAGPVQCAAPAVLVDEIGVERGHGASNIHDRAHQNSPLQITRSHDRASLRLATGDGRDAAAGADGLGCRARLGVPAQHRGRAPRVLDTATRRAHRCRSRSRCSCAAMSTAPSPIRTTTGCRSVWAATRGGHPSPPQHSRRCAYMLPGCSHLGDGTRHGGPGALGLVTTTRPTDMPGYLVRSALTAAGEPGVPGHDDH